MTVELVTASSPEIVEAMERLIPQLSRSAPALTAEQCEALIAQEGVFLFVFRPEAEAGQSAPILGMLTLATFTIPTGLRAWVEDVVVDGEARGQGAGQALVEAAVEYAGAVRLAEGSTEAPDADHQVKGNEDSMKYHVPGSRWYDATVAEVWFASAEDAEAAGFAPAGGAAAQKVEK